MPSAVFLFALAAGNFLLCGLAGQIGTLPHHYLNGRCGAAGARLDLDLKDTLSPGGSHQRPTALLILGVQFLPVDQPRFNFA